MSARLFPLYFHEKDSNLHFEKYDILLKRLSVGKMRFILLIKFWTKLKTFQSLIIKKSSCTTKHCFEIKF